MSGFDEFDVYSGTSTFHEATYNPSTQDDFGTALPEKTFKEEKHVETSIFALSPVRFPLPAPITDFDIANGTVCVGLQNGTITKLNLADAANVNTYEIGKGAEPVKRVFVDLTGDHILISTTNHNYYINSQWKQARKLEKLKTGTINAVSWSQEASPHCTSTFLIGCSNGTIQSCNFDIHVKKERVEEKIKIIGTIEGEITSLESFEYESRSESMSAVLVTTDTRFYVFRGAGNYEAMFAAYEGGEALKFHDFPADKANSRLMIKSPFAGELNNSQYCWTNGCGLYCGKITADHEGFVSVDQSATLINYPEGLENAKGSIITDFHILVASEDCIYSISKLKEKQVTTDFVPCGGALKGIVADPISDTFWAFSSDTIFEVKVDSEGRNEWKYQLEEGNYDEALNMCSSDNQRDTVLLKQADELYQRGRANQAAPLYAKSRKPLEEMALKFIAEGQREALRLYLECKLEHTPERDFTARTMLAQWLIEVFINLCVAKHSSSAESEKKYRQLFHAFLSKFRDDLDAKTTMACLMSHGSQEDVLAYAEIIGDYERIIGHHIQSKNPQAAIKFLLKKNSAELFYRYSPTLITSAPRELIQAWGRMPKLDPRKLIPAIVSYDHEKAQKTYGDIPNQAAVYLRSLVSAGNTDATIHNKLLSFLVKESSSHALLQFLGRQDSHYDREYALRLCTREGKTEACIVLYAVLGQYEQAVNLAISNGQYDTAKENANRCRDNSLKHALWLSIAKHVIQKDNDIRGAIDLLKECPLLSVDDLLPFFPDFTRVEAFKEEICQALESYNTRIDTLRDEMEAATDSARLIRQDIQEIKSTYCAISTSDRCEECRFPALNRRFTIFPCGHTFHTACLVTHTLRLLPSIDVKTINKLQAQAKAATDAGDSTEAASLQSKINQIVSASCPVCGPLMIRSLDVPLVSTSESAITLDSWQI